MWQKEKPIHHLPPLISDLATILAVASVVTLVFKRIGQPVVLGYLLAGLLVGPEIRFFPTVQDHEGVKTWAELGVIVLLFGLGLEFSFKKLAAVGRGASITALTEIFSMLGIGYLLGRIFGWNAMDSIFLGGILSISSTTIIIRAFEELGLKQKRFVQLVFGVLIVEDLVAILLMVLLATIAVSKNFEGMDLAFSALRLTFFLTLWFIAGIFLVPWLLRRTRSIRNQETSLIVAMGLCLLMVILATQAGFSAALGAFIMGSILAETPDAEKIEHALKPVKDLFSAVFFVSVGMLFNVQTLMDHWVAVIVIVLVTVLGKVLSTTAGALISGQGLKSSVQTGMSLAQIGEFSFIIATLGLSLNVISDFLFPMAVAVSVITTFTTPYLIKSSGATYRWLHRTLPASWTARFENEVEELHHPESTKALQRSLLRLFLNTVIVVGIASSAAQWLLPLYESQFKSDWVANSLGLITTLILCLPFLWAMISKTAEYDPTWRNLGDVRQLTLRAFLMLVWRAALVVFLLGFIISRYTSAFLSFALVAAVAIIFGFIGLKKFAKIYNWLEAQFVSHLNEKEKEMVKATKTTPSLAPWDAHLSNITVHPDSQMVGKTLQETGLREKVGVIVALIERGRQQIFAPGREVILMPYDRVYVIANDEQIEKLTPLMGEPVDRTEDASAPKFGLYHFVLSPQSPHIGKSIRESHIREMTKGLIVGVEKGSQRIVNPEADLRLEPDDKIWLVGNFDAVSKLN